MKKILQIALGLIYSFRLFAQPTGPQGDANYTYPQINGPVVNGLPQPPSPWPVSPPDTFQNRIKPI
jgi:hypothetical protein